MTKLILLGVFMLAIFSVGMALVISVDWRIALGIFLIMWANNWSQKQ